MVCLFEEVGIFECYDFCDGCVCYEEIFKDYYDYLIDV